jgi:sugar O-acyltransferase (sialic acid O-acetyltransferase NeuD family)
MDRVVIFGNGQNASLAYANLTQASPHRVVAFTVDREYIQSRTLMDLPVIPFEEIETVCPPASHAMFVAISFRMVNRLRAAKVVQARAKGYTLISHVNPRAIVPPHFQLGDNCLIGAANIAPFVEVGQNVVIASGCVVGHHTVIGDHCYLGPGAVVSGSVTLEPYCFIGSGAVIRDRVTIRESSVIGAGAVILEDTAERGVYLATPAQRLPILSDQLPVG